MKKALLLMAACAFALSSCHHHHHEGEEHGHHHHDGDGHHHEEVVNMSAYSDSWEVCAEAAPFAVGEERDIMAHFTRLSDFKPAAEGVVTATLTAGGKTVSQTVEEPVKAGVFVFELTPEATGEGTLSFTIGGETLTIDTEVFADDEDGEEYAEEHEAKSANGVAFTKEKTWGLDFRTDPAVIRRTGNTIRTMARVDLPETGESVVTAKASGIIAITGGSLPEGTSVRSGQTLFTIEGNSVTDDNIKVRYIQAESEYNLAKSEYERKQMLAEDKIVSQSELQMAQRDYKAAKAVYDNVRNGYSGGRQSAKSPISGFVRTINVRNGQYVEAGQTLAVVSTSDKLCIVAEVPARHYSDLARINGANLKSVNSETAVSVESLGGKLVSYGKSAENGLIPVHFHVKSSTELVPGTYVEMFISTEGDKESVCVLSGAVLEEMGNHFVFRQLNPEYFEKVQVAVGATDGVYTEILSGIEAGERVVSRGTVLVKLSMATGNLDPHAGHVH